MIKSKYKLFELFNIPIYVDISFAILLLFFVTSQGSLFSGFAWAIALAVSVVAHELAHSLTARAFGYRTNDITISLLGGCASLIALPRKAWQEFMTAFAGPFMSFMLAVLAIAMIGVIGDGSALDLTWRSMSGGISIGVSHKLYLYFFMIGDDVIYTCSKGMFLLVDVLLNFACMNLWLGLFNLLPGFPMDGGRIFRSAMITFMSRSKATLVAMWVGRVFAIVLGLSGLYSIFNGGSWGFVRILIAWMIWNEGWREYQMALVEERFSNWQQADFNAKVSPPPYDR